MILKGFLLQQNHGSGALDTERFDNREVGSKDHCEFKRRDLFSHASLLQLLQVPQEEEKLEATSLGQSTHKVPGWQDNGLLL